jgi:peptidoglycan hydrolase-like protein with peptidoglycan-binding domain
MHSVTPASSRSRTASALSTGLVTAATVLVTVLATGLATVAGTATPAAAASPTTGRSSYIVLVPGADGPRVVALQRFLHVRPASGHYGPKTRRAVIRWQAAHHRRQTGLVGKRLWRAVRASTGSRAAAPSRSGDRVTRLNWASLARCESGGNRRAVNPAGYYGLYQFSPATWRSVGGSGLPSRASKAEQTRRAQTLFRRSGSSPWPHCGPRLFR